MMRLVALVAAFAFAAPALAQNHAGKGNYVNIHGQAMAIGVADSFGAGVAIDWGAFQSKYVAAGTRFGFSRFSSMGSTIVADPTIEFGGGPQFHIPLGQNLLVIPAINLGYRLGSHSAGMGINVSIAAAYRLDSFYIGAELDSPMWLQGAPTFFPGPSTLNALLGIYY